ncbi:MAG: membrane protein insertase YidC [Desulfobulbaceae bacterium]|jgi:YidC/Oxa1 family membrane protein insertase|nr:membrane protein insertase YidC [Desulfobulbaceae bacterium]
MDNKRALLAVVLSLGILLVYNQLFVSHAPPVVPIATQTSEVMGQSPDAAVTSISPSSLTPPVPLPVMASGREGVDVVVETSLYTAVFTENGGGLKSFKLKNYTAELAGDSGEQELVVQTEFNELPLYFSWGADPSSAAIPLYEADRTALVVRDDAQTLTMNTRLPSGVVMRRMMTFHPDSYVIDLEVQVSNGSTEHQVQGAPFLRLVNEPFAENMNSRFLFTGPAQYAGGVFDQFKVADLEDGKIEKVGVFDWIGYEGIYFMMAVVPGAEQQTVSYQLLDPLKKKVSTTLSSGAVALSPGNIKSYSYSSYLGPKKLEILKGVGSNLSKAVNFGFFDFLAKPMLFLLNFIFDYVKNYGVAIILLTVLIKAVFWPLSYKGMKSMKAMQKLGPKMTQIREKYSDDRDRMNREMMQLYKTYNVSPVGGCLPMLAQIPVFFALYRLLMQTIELRHAPFFGWITDLSAPERLFIGFDLPYLGGLPLLTLCMGLSMFLQQKLTPQPADATQAKIMMFMPVIFTVISIKFASGLVLYWLVNNLLSMLQQYAINKAPD